MTKKIEQISGGPFLWTLEKYHDAIEKGVLTELDRVELIFGQLIAKMPVGEAHADLLSDLSDYFYDKLGKRYKFRVQNPITLPNESEPEPDFAIVVRKSYNKRTGHPTPDDILLVIEVSDSTLIFDRQQKQEAYARASVQEYWIINLPDRQLELHLRPDPSSAGYQQITRHPKGTSFVSPFCGEVLVDDVLPLAEEA